MQDPTGTVEKVTFNRRFWGDSVLEGLLFTITLGIGWLIWLIFTAKTAQTPAKRILNTYVIDIDTGQPISAGRVWVREVLVKLILIGLVGAVIAVASLIDAIWVFFDKNRQALHDKVVSTIVVYAPSGLPANMLEREGMPRLRSSSPTLGNTEAVSAELRDLAKLHSEGILNDEEYETKRRALAERL